jgi:hypothetical protein
MIRVQKEKARVAGAIKNQPRGLVHRKKPGFPGFFVLV